MVDDYSGMVSGRRPCESTRQRILSLLVQWFLDSDDGGNTGDAIGEDKEDETNSVEGTVRSCISSFVVVLVGGIVLLYSMGEDPTALIMSFAEYLNQFMEYHEMSITDFASLVGVSRQTASKWVNGRGLPDVRQWHKIARCIAKKEDGFFFDVLYNMSKTI